MSDFIAFSEEIDTGMEYLEHHGILNQKWGHRNGPPYPLNAGSHSAGEKSAAKAAGIKIGKSSGKGTIEKIKKFGSSSKSSPDKPQKAAKKEMTPEEKREAALEAVRNGDKKQIAKYIDQLSTDELRDAQNRAQMRDSLTKKDPSEQKASKADIEKMEAMRSGDKDKVKEYADQMTYSELKEAMDKVNLTEQLNRVDPPPSAMEKLTKFMNSVDQFRANAEKAVNAYNLAAKVYNSTHKDSAQWPIIENKQEKKEKSKEEQVAQNLFNQMSKNVQQAHQENTQNQNNQQPKPQPKPQPQQQQKQEEQKPQEEPKPKQTPSNEEVDRAAEKAYKEISNRIPDDPDDMEYQNSSQKTQSKNQYTPERAPQIQSAKFNTNKSTEPTEEQKQLVEEARKSDEQYLNQMRDNVQAVREVKTQKLSDYSDSSYDDLIPDSVKSYMSSTPINRFSSDAISREEYNRIKAESEARAKAFTEETNARIEKSQSNARETQAKLDRYDKVHSENAAEEARIKARNEQREKAEANERLNQAREKWQRDIDEAHRESQRISRELFGRELDLPPADKPYWWDDPTQVPKDYR